MKNTTMKQQMKQPTQQRSDVVKVLHAVKSVFHAVTAIRGSNNHATATHGLTFRHYAMGAAIGAALIALMLFTLVKIATSFV